jgi:hypothetical protein
MIEYKDPIPPVLNLLFVGFADSRTNFYGGLFPSSPRLPAVLVRQTGGNNYYRLQLLARANTDIEAMGVLIEAINYLKQYAQFITGLRVLWCEMESNPISAIDEDTGLPEAWCYMRLETAETNSMG